MNEMSDRSSLAPAPDWAEIRKRYAATQDRTYLNTGSHGLLSDTVHAAVAARLESERMMNSGNPNEVVLAAETRARFATLIGATAEEICFTRNVSEGLNAVASAVSWKAGDNVVVTETLEHANNVYLWQSLAKRHGIELRVVAQDRGMIDAAAMAAAVDERTRLVTACAVTFTPGFRTDLATIGAAARKVGAVFLVDGVQCAGVLRLNVDTDMIDALVVSTNKGLNGVRGFGFLYVRKSWIPRLEPVAIARTGIATAGHYSGFEGHEFAYRDDAQRFEVGALNYLGMTAAHAALGETLAIGIPAIERRARAVAQQLRDGLEKQGWPVTRPSSPEFETHLVTVGVRGNGGGERTEDPKLDAFADALKAAGVMFTIRRNLLRFGFHLWSDESDVAVVLGVGEKLR